MKKISNAKPLNATETQALPAIALAILDRVPDREPLPGDELPVRP